MPAGVDQGKSLRALTNVSMPWVRVRAIAGNLEIDEDDTGPVGDCGGTRWR